MNWQRVFQIARWEYKQKASSKAFVASLILLPVMMLAFGLLPSILASKAPSTSSKIAVLDKTGKYNGAVQSKIKAKGTLENGQSLYVPVEYLGGGVPFDSAHGQARSDALNEEIEGVLIVEESDGVPVFLYQSPNVANIRVVQAMKSIGRDVTMTARLQRANIDSTLFNEINGPIAFEAKKLSAEGESDEDAETAFLNTFFSAFIGLILFMILILTTGQSLVRGLVEEKSNRIMEILVGAGTPSELMWGKLFGLSLLGLTQLVAWGALGILLYLAVSSTSFIPSEFSFDILSSLPYVLLYIGLGYLFYSALFIGVGSLVTTEQEAQFVTQYLTIFIVAPLAFSFMIMENPGAPYIQGLSYIPFLTPSMMILRVVTKEPPYWEILATTGLMIFSTGVVTWMAGRVFRTAILLYGKRPSFREVLRWLK